MIWLALSAAVLRVADCTSKWTVSERPSNSGIYSGYRLKTRLLDRRPEAAFPMTTPFEWSSRKPRICASRKDLEEDLGLAK